mgnify:CR=1 FL=1
MNLDFSVLTRDSSGCSQAGPNGLGNYQKLANDDDLEDCDSFNFEINS